MFNFEKLETWQKAIDFADLVYSISSNIAEGTSRMSRTDYARFLEIASGSLFEVVSQSVIGLRKRFLNKASYDKLFVAAEEQSRMLSGLRRSLVHD